MPGKYQNKKNASDMVLSATKLNQDICSQTKCIYFIVQQVKEKTRSQ